MLDCTLDYRRGNGGSKADRIFGRIEISVFLSCQARPACMKPGLAAANPGLQNRGRARLGLQAAKKPAGRQAFCCSGF